VLYRSYPQCFILTPRLRGEIKGGEGEGAYRATFFACLQELLGRILRF
jgi:hypothetical protein